MGTSKDQPLTREYATGKIKSSITKISNGFEFWLAFGIKSGIEITNIIAEGALREHVIQRKIIVDFAHM